MPVGEPLDFFEKFDFVVEIDGIRRAGFKTCSELSMEIGKVELREGGRSIPHKKPGLVSFTDVTLERGATNDLDLYEWARETADASSGRGEVAEKYKRNLDVVVLDRDGSERRRYTLNKAWPVKYVAGEWDAEGEEAVVESITLTFDFFEKTA